MTEPSILLESLPARLRPHFRDSEYGPEIHLPVLTDLLGADAEQDGWIYVFSGAEEQPLSRTQIELADRLIAEQRKLGFAIFEAVMHALPNIRTRFENDSGASVPSTAEEVAKALQLVSMHLHDVGPGAAVLGTQFNCDWDAEHGLGVLSRDGKVLGVDLADVAILSWMAERAAAGTYDFLFPLQG